MFYTSSKVSFYRFVITDHLSFVSNFQPAALILEITATHYYSQTLLLIPQVCLLTTGIVSNPWQSLILGLVISPSCSH